MRIEGRKSRESGAFSVIPDREIYGELKLAGRGTALSLHDKEFFNPRGIRNLNGTLHDRTKVTLIDCISPGPGSGGPAGDQYHFATVFPHFVIYGCHLAPDQPAISEVRFVVDDATRIFHDYDAFGTLWKSEPFIDQIVRADNPDRNVVTGNNPLILYFTGKHEIFSADTTFGRIVSSHAFKLNSRSPKGVGIKNKIVVSITFEELLKFEEAIERVWTLTQFLGLVAGRPQNMLYLFLRVEEGNERFPVYLSLPPKRRKRLDRQKPHPRDIALDAIRKPEEFTAVLCNWLEKHKTWRDARGRFFSCFGKQGSYGVDRLIAAANMFDILPSQSVPKNVELSDELTIAKSKSLDLFRSLGESPERDSALSALGRLGKPSLKQKVRHRAKMAWCLLDCPV